MKQPALGHRALAVFGDLRENGRRKIVAKNQWLLSVKSMIFVARIYEM